MITVEVLFDVNDFSKDLEKVISDTSLKSSDLSYLGDELVKDIKWGIDNGVDLNGHTFVPNTPEWRKRKGDKPVYIGRTKRLYQSIKKTLYNNMIIVNVRSGGVYWQDATNHPSFKREFFGISNRFLKKVDNWLTSKKT